MVLRQVTEAGVGPSYRCQGSIDTPALLAVRHPGCHRFADHGSHRSPRRRCLGLEGTNLLIAELYLHTMHVPYDSTSAL